MRLSPALLLRLSKKKTRLWPRLVVLQIVVEVYEATTRERPDGRAIFPETS
jgi:hypothetical protein